MIVSQDRIRAAYQRALAIDPADSEAAIRAVAHSLVLDVETVREVVETEQATA